MKVRGIDGNNDWLFGKGKNDYKKDSDAVAQMIKTRLQMFLGDCFFAIDQGIDWYGLLGSKAQVQLKLAVAATILNTTDVTKVVEISTILSKNRVMIIQYSVETSYGSITGTVQGV